MKDIDNEILKLTTLSKKSLVVKGNPLVQAKFDELSAIEYKIIIIAISNLTPADQKLETISFTANEFCKLLNIQKIGMYSHLKETCGNLMKRTITVETSKKNWIKFSWLHYIEYKDGTIILKFHPKLEPYLLFWKENNMYTKYFLENVIYMEKKYSMRVYELTKQYETIGHRTFDLNELKELLGIPKNKYIQLAHLRNRVLIPSKEEVNGLSDINVDYNLIKEGRKVTKIQYLIQKKSYTMHNTNNYDLLPKLKLVHEIKKKIYILTGFVFEINLLKNYHRVILIELLKRFENNSYSKIVIQYPRAFFKWHLDDISKMFELQNTEDY